jgi:hypothetical protein
MGNPRRINGYMKEKAIATTEYIKRGYDALNYFAIEDSSLFKRKMKGIADYVRRMIPDEIHMEKVKYATLLGVLVLAAAATRAKASGADINNEDIVNFLDYAILAKDWKETGLNLPGDIYKDKKVDHKDLKILVEDWLCENTVEWIAIYGGSRKMYEGCCGEYANSTTQTSDGGYITAGFIGTYAQCGYCGPIQGYVIKFDSYGNPEWNKTYGYEAFDIEQTKDKGYIVGGSNGEFYILKLDPNGVAEWEKTFSESLWTLSTTRSIQQTSDGGYIAAGDIEVRTSHLDHAADGYILKTDPNGNKEWDKTFGGEYWDYAYEVQQTSDGGYIVGGATNIGGWKAYVLKLDPNGVVEWDENYVGTSTIYSIQQTSDGGYIATRGNGHILKLLSNGDIEWEKPYGGGEDGSIRQTSDGGYVTISGSTIFKLDTNGNIEWERTFGGTGHSIEQTLDGGYIGAGHITNHCDDCPSPCNCYDYVYLIKLSRDINGIKIITTDNPTSAGI